MERYATEDVRRGNNSKKKKKKHIGGGICGGNLFPSPYHTDACP
jgi:hypothetical protein